MVLLLLLTDRLPLSHVASPFYYHHHTPTYFPNHPSRTICTSLSHFIYPQRHSSGHRHPLDPTILSHFLPAQHSTLQPPPQHPLPLSTLPILIQLNSLIPYPYLSNSPLSSHIHTYPTPLSHPISILIQLPSLIPYRPSLPLQNPLNPTLPPSFRSPCTKHPSFLLLRVFSHRDKPTPPHPTPPFPPPNTSTLPTTPLHEANPPPPNSAHRTESSNAIRKQYGFTD